MSRTGRNEPCPCGSGIKYKKCCLKKENEMNEVVSECDIFDQESILNTIDKIGSVESGENMFAAYIQKAQLFQKLGQHVDAIECFPNNFEYSVNQDVIRKYTQGISFMALGLYSNAIDNFEYVLKKYDKRKWDVLVTAGMYLEVGKAYSNIGNDSRAIDYWRKSANLFKNRSEVDYSRAVSNIGLKMLHSNVKSEVELGVQMINDSSSVKAKYGDLQGLSSNYCNLGAHYLRMKEYTKAMQKFRWDLKVSKMIPDKNNLILSHKNLALMYLEMLQLKEAREQIRVGIILAKEIRNESLIRDLNNGLKIINEKGKELSSNNIKIGKKANCICNSGKTYEDCCGVADYEPIPFPWDMSKPFNLDHLDNVARKMEEHNVEPNVFDFIFRRDNDVQGRVSWNRVQFSNGLLKYSELPDIANQHLSCAIVLAEEARTNPNDFAKPVSCLLLCACALEAFINQAAFFMNEKQTVLKKDIKSIPQEILDDPLRYQRHTELQTKWSEIGNILCGSHWDEKCEVVNDFKLLVALRNEFVHFKSFEYEQLIPPPKIENKYIKKLNGKIEFNDKGEFPLPWSRRVLTPSLAEWCVKTSEDLIDYIKTGYYKNRVEITK